MRKKALKIVDSVKRSTTSEASINKSRIIKLAIECYKKAIMYDSFFILIYTNLNI